ncbi:MAG: hypothetical protein IKM97_03600 [Clostridia bacterium]|nr:hypothetical protein [Clostridia bacterium]
MAERETSYSDAFREQFITLYIENGGEFKDDLSKKAEEIRLRKENASKIADQIIASTHQLLKRFGIENQEPIIFTQLSKTIEAAGCDRFLSSSGSVNINNIKGIVEKKAREIGRNNSLNGENSAPHKEIRTDDNITEEEARRRIEEIDFTNLSITDIIFIGKNFDIAIQIMDTDEKREEFVNQMGKGQEDSIKEELKKFIDDYRRLKNGELSSEQKKAYNEIAKDKGFKDYEEYFNAGRVSLFQISDLMEQISGVLEQQFTIDKNELTENDILKILPILEEHEKDLSFFNFNSKNFLYGVIVSFQKEQTKKGKEISLPKDVTEIGNRTKEQIEQIKNDDTDMEQIYESDAVVLASETEAFFDQLMDGVNDFYVGRGEEEKTESRSGEIDGINEVAELDNTALIRKSKTILDKMEETGNPVLVAIANNRLVKGISNRLSAFRNRAQKTNENLGKIEGNSKSKTFDDEDKPSFGLGDPGVPATAVTRNSLARAGESVMAVFKGVASLFSGNKENVVDNKPNEFLNPSKAETNKQGNSLNEGQIVNVFAVDQATIARTIKAGRAAAQNAKNTNRIIPQSVGAKRTGNTVLSDHDDGPSL